MDKDTEYDIINGIDLFEFIYKFDSKDENFDKYKISILDSVDTNDNYESYVSYFDMDGYIENIKKSYGYREDKIYGQFQIDYHRQSIKLNNYQYDNDTFIKYIGKLLLDATPSKIFDMSWQSFIVMLCCQSSFALPYLILQKKYVTTNINENKVLVSGGLNSININITINSEKVLIELNNMSFLKDIETNKKIDKIRSSVTIELSKKMKDKLYDPLICVFSWKIFPCGNI